MKSWLKGKRTVLSDSLEFELNKLSRDSWRFMVRENTCSEEDCNCELISVHWFGHPFTCCNHPDDPLSKTWGVEEVNRRKNIEDFAHAMIDRLTNMIDEKQ